jgi:hypothetical protein
MVREEKHSHNLTLLIVLGHQNDGNVKLIALWFHATTDRRMIPISRDRDTPRVRGEMYFKRLYT